MNKKRILCFTLLIALLMCASASLAADNPIIKKSALIYITFETPNKNFLSTEHKPITKEDIYEFVYLGDGGTKENPVFPSIADFYRKATNDKLQLVEAIDSLGRGPIIEVVVPDEYAISWDIYSNTTHPTRGTAAWNNFLNNVVLPKAAEKFNFYEFADAIYTSGGQEYAQLTTANMAIGIVFSGYATSTDQMYVWHTPNIHGTVGAPSIWANSGGTRNANITLYRTPADAKSLVNPSLDVANKGLRISAFITNAAATSPSDDHFYGPRGFGVYAHEMGHSAFSFSDTYDIAGYYRVQNAIDNVTNEFVEIPYPMRPAMGIWSIMSMGGYIFYTNETEPTSEFFKKYYNPKTGAEPLNFRPGLLDAFNLINRAGLTPTVLTDASGDVLPEYEGKTITVQRGWDLYRINTHVPNQYFLLQARADLDYDMGPFQWGRRFSRPADKNIKGGLLIMHLDQGFTDGTGSSNPYSLNRPYVVKEAHGGTQDLLVRRIYDRSGDSGKYNVADPGDLFGVRAKDFGRNTDPSNRLYFSNPMGLNTNPLIDAAQDPNRQITNFGESANWHLSEITYHEDNHTVTFKITTAQPAPTPTEQLLGKSAIAAGDVDSLANELGIGVSVPDPDAAYQDHLAALGVKDDPYYAGILSDDFTAIDGAEYHASVKAGDGFLTDVYFPLPDGDFDLIVLFASGESINLTSDLPQLSPVVGGGKVKVTTLVVDNRVEDYDGVLYQQDNPIYGVKLVTLPDGTQVLVIFDGKKDGEAGAVLFLVEVEEEEVEKIIKRSGGGCNVGYVVLVLLALCPFIRRKG
ncbi:MAG: SYNERG-CTERM sorting domain-containing protein [Synergistaceae bacterium]|nr:SYNERG-CTERM sorting domain-containing protein [Synergistaceae bacterium]